MPNAKKDCSPWTYHRRRWCDLVHSQSNGISCQTGSPTPRLVAVEIIFIWQPCCVSSCYSLPNCFFLQLKKYYDIVCFSLIQYFIFGSRLDPDSGIQGLKKRSKMSNNHNINLLFSDFSFNFLVTFTRFCHSIDFLNLLIRKSYNYEVIKKKNFR